MSDPAAPFDIALLRRRRARAAPGAAAHDFLLERVVDDLLDRLGSVMRRFPVAADLGAHHGLLARRLAGVAGIETVVAVEAVPALAARCPPPVVQAGEEALPFRDGALDLVVSALALHHVNDLPGVLVQARRALKPDGLFIAALLAGRTLHELRDTLLAAEVETTGGAGPRVAPFADIRDLGALLQRAGFALPVADADTVTVTYPNVVALMRELRAFGATNVLRDRSRRPLRRATLLRAGEIYAERYGLPDGRIPATFEIVTLTAWAPGPDQPKPLRPGSARVRLADVLGVDERSVETEEKSAPYARRR